MERVASSDFCYSLTVFSFILATNVFLSQIPDTFTFNHRNIDFLAGGIAICEHQENIRGGKSAVGFGIHYARLLDASMLTLLLTDKHPGIGDQPLPIALRNAVGHIVALNECLVFPVKQVVIVLLGSMGGLVSRIDT